MGKYDDIINLPHHVSKKHPRLSMEQRAAQFAPFAALTGFGDAINETSRITENRIELDVGHALTAVTKTIVMKMIMMVS